VNKRFAVYVGIAGLLVAGCSGGSDGANPAPRPAASSSSSGPQAALKAAMVATLATEAHVAMNVQVAEQGSGPVPALDVVGDYDMGAQTGQLVATQGSDKVTELFTRDAVYAKPFGGLDQDKWAMLSRGVLAANYLMRTPGNDPAALVRQVGELSGVQEVGSDTVDGTAMKHYRGTYDRQVLTEYLAAAMKDQAAALDVKYGPFFADVWVDANTGRIGRVVLAYKASMISSTTQVDLTYPGKAAVAKVTAPADAVAVDPSVPTMLTG